MNTAIQSNSDLQVSSLSDSKKLNTTRSILSFEGYLNKHKILPDSHLVHIEVFFVFMAVQLKINTLTIHTLKSAISKYKEQLDQLIVIDRQRLPERNALLASLAYFIQYLFEMKSMDVRPNKSLLFLNEPLFDDLGCTYFRDYIQSFIKRNYTSVQATISFVRHFLKHINIPATNIEQLTLEHVKVYEKRYYLDRVIREEITKQSARRMLDVVKNFLIYLKDLGVVRFSYRVPKDLFGTETRDNEFVQSKYLIAFYETLNKQKTLTSAKFLCVFLLLVETGCRPIEICNLRFRDFNQTESTLSFTSIKSDTRTLKIDPYIKRFLVQYIKNQRKCLLPNESLFCRKDGTPLQTADIGQYIRKINQLAFGKIIFSAKTLRHTYITNALQDRNSFDQVSKSVGHNNWRSTMHYLHRSVQRLLDNTLPYNPNTRSNEHGISNKV